MKLKLPAAVTNKFGRQILHLQKASPRIMFVGGMIGLGTAGVLACRSTLKLSDVLDEAEKKKEMAAHEHDINAEKYPVKDYTKDLAVIKVRTGVEVAKLYAPAVGLAIVSVALITGSHVILTKRNAGLTAAYAALDKAYNEYRDRVRTELGAEQDQKFRYGVQTIEETVEGKDGKMKTVKHERASDGVPSMYARIFGEESTAAWQPNAEYNRAFLMAQQKYANDMLIARGHVTLNDVYDALGLPRTTAGAVVGWAIGSGGDDYIDFGIFDEANNPKVRDFVNLAENSILLDFNVDGIIYDKIG